MQYSIKLGLKGQVEKVENQDNLSMAAFICHHVNCDIFEKVNVQGLKPGYFLVVDEEGSFKETPVINPFASWLYGFQMHGCPILGIALVLKLVDTPEGKDFGFLDEQETDLLIAWLNERRSFMSRDLRRALKHFGDGIILRDSDNV